MIQRFWCTIVFLVLTAEFEGFWGHRWWTPMHYVGDVLFGPVPGIHIPWYDVVVLLLLLTAQRNRKREVRPLVVAVWTSVAAMAAWAVKGALSSGSLLDMRLQLHTIVMVMISAVMQMRVLRTREHFNMLGKAIVYAALLRAALIFVFYITIWRGLDFPLRVVTQHADSLLFVTAATIVLANAVHQRNKKVTLRAAVITAVMMWCIQVNGRRLAYVGFAGSLFILVALLWTSDLRRKLQKHLYTAFGLLAVYTAIGWSNPTGIFKPLASLQTVNDVNDPSTQSRILENIGLVVTLQQGPLLGTGFGQKYVEISSTFSVQDYFPQYRYVPHNSLLGLLAFTGGLGFALIWMVFPVTAYFAARAYQFATLPLDKTVAAVALCEVLIHAVQMWGDIGITANPGLVLVSSAMAAAANMALTTGAWPAARSSAAGV